MKKRLVWMISFVLRKAIKMYLIFDTETTGLPDYKLPLDDPNQARVLQLACILLDEEFKEINCFVTLIKPDGWTIHPKAQAAHGITLEECAKDGIPIEEALTKFDELYNKAELCIAHNIKFDAHMLSVEQTLLGHVVSFSDKEAHGFCTMLSTTKLCKLPGRIPGTYKWPKLVEALKILCNHTLVDAHDALADCRGTAILFKHLVTNKLVDISKLSLA